MSPLTPDLLSKILAGYALPPAGTHGISHWARVLENGRKVAGLSGAELDVVELFAIFHDARRLNEAWDHGHGRRGAALARQLRGSYFDLDDQRFALLEYACQEHTAGLTQADLSVQACWDADRLDLLRVGTRPHPDRLCTDAAKSPEVLAWANERASRRDAPSLIRDEWGLDL